MTQTQTERERESELATRNGVGNDAVMAAKSRLLLYYECNCNTQANIAHAVITTVRECRRVEGGGGTATGHELVAGGHFSKLNSTRLNRTHGTFGVSWPDGRIVRIVAKLTDIPVLVSNACHFIYYTHTH